jgi:hypothetical protein
MRHGFDAKCYELAKAFLSDEPEIDNEVNRADLAQSIQTAIEDGIEYMKPDPPAAPDVTPGLAELGGQAKRHFTAEDSMKDQLGGGLQGADTPSPVTPWLAEQMCPNGHLAYVPCPICAQNARDLRPAETPSCGARCERHGNWYEHQLEHYCSLPAMHIGNHKIPCLEKNEA